MVPDLSKSILQVVSDGLHSKNRVRHKILSMTMVILYILRDVLTLNEEEKIQLVPQEEKKVSTCGRVATARQWSFVLL